MVSFVLTLTDAELVRAAHIIQLTPSQPGAPCSSELTSQNDVDKVREAIISQAIS